jgi:hypothetical protein
MNRAEIVGRRKFNLLYLPISTLRPPAGETGVSSIILSAGTDPPGPWLVSCFQVYFWRVFCFLRFG